MTTLDELAARVRTLEDIEAIKRLKAQYCAYCDDGYDADGLATLFTDDAVWDGGEVFGRAEGREKIRRFLGAAPRVLPFARHYVTNPLIEVDGDEATARWLLLEPCTLAGESDPAKAMWLAASYLDRCVRTPEGWKFHHVTISPAFYTPYDGEGWARQALQS
ncbi:MAG: nuclear transport factor 2 family protein [Acidimicrobiales bacterium]